MKVLIAEDDPLTRAGLSEILAAEGYEVLEASDGDTALEQLRTDRPDFVCLDIMMPNRSGFEVCRQIRASHPTLPIVFISAKGEEIDKVVGLELGADDFIVKPFGAKELVARIRAVERRCRTSPAPMAEPFWLGDLEVRPLQLQAVRGEAVISLSPRDVRILALFCQRAGDVLDRRTIFTECWDEAYYPNSRTIDQHISQLRKRIEADPRHPTLIRTVHGAGYRYLPP